MLEWKLRQPRSHCEMLIECSVSGIIPAHLSFWGGFKGKDAKKEQNGGCISPSYRHRLLIMLIVTSHTI